MFKSLNNLSQNLGMKIVVLVLILALTWKLWPLAIGVLVIVAGYKMKLGRILYLLSLVVLLSSGYLEYWWINYSRVEPQRIVRTTPTPTKSITKQGPFKIFKVVDGDTIKVVLENSEVKTVRLIGINSPETVDPRKPVECFGKEASEKLKSLLTDKPVYLAKDDTQSNEDKYGRWLRYVYLEDGTLINKLMISQGYAYEYTYDKPYEFQREFKDAQAQAQRNKLGLWAPNACVTPTVEPTKGTPTPQVTPAISTVSCSCESNLYNCSSFNSQQEAQTCFDYCGGVNNDIHKLDGNDDGIVCEDYFSNN